MGATKSPIQLTSFIGREREIADVLSGRVGWATIIWNPALLAAIPIFKPRDIYYPFVHYIAPLLIGITLLAGR